MAVIMGVASPYWMKSIEPAVVSTLPQTTGVRAQAQTHDNKDNRVVPSSPAALAVQTESAAGGQK
jgi:hypothetical protein